MPEAVPESPRDLGLPFDEFRPGQRKAIAQIINEIKGKRIIVLEGPTGSGKSAIGLSVAAMLEAKTVVTTQTKQLARQYQESFDFVKIIEGRDNFYCPLVPSLTCAEGPCITSFKCVDKKSICPYYIQKNEAIESGCAITNIWYYINEVNFVGALGGRDLLIVDEGHLLEQALLSVVSIDISADQFARVGISRIPSFGSVTDAVSWAMGNIGKLTKRFESIDYDGDPKGYRRYKTQISKLKDLIDNANEREWLLTKNFYGYSVKPVWVTKYGTPLVFSHAERVLVMSATIRDPTQFAKTLGINESEMAYVEMPNYFPKENRPINFWPVAPIGYKSSHDEMMRMVDAVDRILEKHEHEKGVLHTVSYKLRDLILENTKYIERFIYHDFKNREQVIEEFKNSSGNYVLISPSVAIGLDLPDDQGRFNIIAKVPWLDLSDLQVKRRQKEDPGWYVWSTVCALIQSCGRTTRSGSDWSTSYILDQNAEWFLKRNSKMFPQWWKEAVYRIGGVDEAVVPSVVSQEKFI